MDIGTGMTENDLLAALQEAMSATVVEEEDHPTTAWLADKMGISRRKVQTTLRQLVKNSIVEPYKIKVMCCNGVMNVSYAYRVKEQ